QTYIFAVGQVSGQSELVVSEIIQIGTEDSNQVADTLSLGFLSVSPVIASDSSLINMIEDGGSITLNWLGMRTIGYRAVAPVSFYYEDTAGNITLIGQDNDDSNGISITWQTPPNVTGRVYAEGLFMTTQYDLFRRVVIINGGQIQSLVED
ncbi:MAG: hypothetical protein WBC91_07645, partial [Phototrophicaceae bacterium]